MEKQNLRKNKLVAKLPLWLLRGSAISIVSIAICLIIAGNKIVPNEASAQCIPVGLTYVGSCNASPSATCTCGGGTTIMLLTSSGFANSNFGQCTVENQNSSAVQGRRMDAGRACSFSCFK